MEVSSEKSQCCSVLVPRLHDVKGKCIFPVRQKDATPEEHTWNQVKSVAHFQIPEDLVEEVACVLIFCLCFNK